MGSKHLQKPETLNLKIKGESLCKIGEIAQKTHYYSKESKEDH